MGTSRVPRWALLGVLAIALIAALVVLLTGGSGYRVRLLFRDASGLVTGNQVLIGPATVGKVESIGLTPKGQAAIVVSVDADAAPLRRGTVARIVDSGLASIAGHYITLQPAAHGAKIPSGGTISAASTHSEVGLDQLFNAFNPATRAGLKNIIRGEATAIDGRTGQASRTLEYLDPALASTSRVTAELSRSDARFNRLLVRGAQTLRALASRSRQLTELVSNTDRATGAIAQQSAALSSSLALLPPTLSKSTGTFAGLRRTLDALSPVVAAAKPGVRRLPQLLAGLGTLATTARPAVVGLRRLISAGSGGPGALTALLEATPMLAAATNAAVPQLVTALSGSRPQLDYLRDYTPDLVAALANLGQASAYYDANGHYARAAPFFGAFGINANNQLTKRPPSARYKGLEVVHGRCPGGAVQPAPDKSAPRHVPGCNPSATPPGP